MERDTIKSRGLQRLCVAHAYIFFTLHSLKADKPQNQFLNVEFMANFPEGII